MDIINKLAIIYDFSKQTSTFETLGIFQEYTDVSVFCEWSGINGYDAVIELYVLGHQNQNVWMPVPRLIKTLNVDNDGVQFRHKIFSGRSLGIKITNNNCIEGILKIFINTNK